MMKHTLIAAVLFAGCAAQVEGDEVPEVGVDLEAICDTHAAPEYIQSKAWDYYHSNFACSTWVDPTHFAHCGGASPSAQYDLYLHDSAYQNGTTITYQVKRDLPPPGLDQNNWSKVTCGCTSTPSNCTFYPH